MRGIGIGITRLVTECSAHEPNWSGLSVPDGSGASIPNIQFTASHVNWSYEAVLCFAVNRSHHTLQPLTEEFAVISFTQHYANKAYCFNCLSV